MSDRSPSQFWEPEPRYGTCCGVVKHSVYLWGGKLNSTTFAPTDEVSVFNVDVLKWATVPVAGVRPAGVFRAATASIGHFVFSFGGYTKDGFSNELLELNTSNCTFARVSIINAAEGPMRKHSCGMIAVSAETLVVVGGYGKPGAALPRGFVRFKDGRGWTNEIHLLN